MDRWNTAEGLIATRDRQDRQSHTDPVASEAHAEDRGEPDRPDLRTSANNRLGGHLAQLTADVEELLAERGVTVDHVTVYRWVQRFTPEFIEAARFCRHTPGDRWFADETYIKVAGLWTYLYRAVDQHGQVIDVMLSQRRDLAAARRFFNRALRTGTIPAEVTTDRAPAYPRVLDELIPSALHTIERYANNPVETDHGRLKARQRPMRGLKRRRSARILAAGHAFIQNLRRTHYELATDVPARHRLHEAFDQLTMAI